MENARPPRLPGILLITVACLVGICALPSAAYFVLIGIAGGSDPGPGLVIGAPVLVAYPVAVWLWLRARRPRSTGRAWLLAVLGLLLVTGTAIVPVTIIGTALVDEWRETQPGGRGYEPPASPP